MGIFAVIAALDLENFLLTKAELLLASAKAEFRRFKGGISPRNLSINLSREILAACAPYVTGVCGNGRGLNLL